MTLLVLFEESAPRWRNESWLMEEFQRGVNWQLSCCCQPAATNVDVTSTITVDCYLLLEPLLHWLLFVLPLKIIADGCLYLLLLFLLLTIVDMFLPQLLIVTCCCHGHAHIVVDVASVVAVDCWLFTATMRHWHWNPNPMAGGRPLLQRCSNTSQKTAMIAGKVPHWCSLVWPPQIPAASILLLGHPAASLKLVEIFPLDESHDSSNNFYGESKLGPSFWQRATLKDFTDFLN